LFIHAPLIHVATADTEETYSADAAAAENNTFLIVLANMPIILISIMNMLMKIVMKVLGPGAYGHRHIYTRAPHYFLKTYAFDF